MTNTRNDIEPGQVWRFTGRDGHWAIFIVIKTTEHEVLGVTAAASPFDSWLKLDAALGLSTVAGKARYWSLNSKLELKTPHFTYERIS